MHSTGIPCYLVVALDDEIYKFLHNWLPEHVVRAPQGFTPAVPRQFAETGTAAARHVSRARLASLKAIADQARSQHTNSHARTDAAIILHCKCSLLDLHHCKPSACW